MRFGGPLHESDYKTFAGIRREWIDRAGIVRVSDAEGRAAVGQKARGNFEGLLIPYTLPDDDRPREYCLRRDTPDIEYGANGERKEKKKYVFPVGRGNILYFPPDTTTEQLADAGLPIVITEGAKKVLALQQTASDAVGETSERPAYIAVGLSGVWNFRGTIGKENDANGRRRDVKGVISDFSLITLKGRKVVICFDTNVRANDSVQAARAELTRELRQRGAMVHWFAWPSDTPGPVNGIDDYLAIAGPQRVLQLIEGAKPFKQTTREVKVWTLAELREAQFAVAKPLIDGMLAEGETIALIGRPKAGKSRLVQQLAIDVSRGVSFLGHAVKQPKRVLLLDLENRPQGARARFIRMSTAAPGDRNLLVYAPDTLAGNAVNLSTKDGIACLEEMVRELQPEVLIVDTWRLLLAGDENKTEVVVAGLKSLSRLREALPKLGSILVHHLRKQRQCDNPARLRIDPARWVEAASGHYSFIGHVDACYGLEREVDRDSGEEMIVFGGIARNAAPDTVLLEEDTETLLFRVAEGEEAAQRIMTAAEKAIWASVSELREFTFSEAVETARTKNRKAVTSTLRKAESVGLIERGLDKVYRQGTRKRN
jgi:hypothetical protein